MSDLQNFAVVKTGGKQYRVHVGKFYRFEKLEGEPGSEIELSDVLLTSQDGAVDIGLPMLKGAKVVGEILRHGRAKKVIIIKFKRRQRYRRKQGHRQYFTEVMITGIKAA